MELITVTQLTKTLEQHQVYINAKDLYKWLIKAGYLNEDKTPTALSIQLKLFIVVGYELQTNYKTSRSVTTTKVTEDGVKYFIDNKILIS